MTEGFNAMGKSEEEMKEGELDASIMSASSKKKKKDKKKSVVKKSAVGPQSYCGASRSECSIF